MRALVCRQHGTPDSLELADWPEPPLDGGQVRIAVACCGINFPDVLIVAGRYQVQPDLPFIPGAEVAGTVVETAPGVTGIAVGQRVLAYTGHGGMAEQLCADVQRVLPIPDTMPFDTAAGFLLTYGTSQHALRQRARLAAGETLLVTGAAGGVGLAAVELGKAAGARVIAAASTPDKLATAREHGADDCIDYAKDSLRDRVMEMTGGRGADVIYDPVGGDLFDQCLRSVAWNGRILVVGFASGSIQKIPANLPLLKGSAIVGVFWGRFVEQEPGAHADNVRELLALYDAGRIRPHVSQTFDLADGARALETLAGRRAVGKLVLRVDGDNS